ncbi:hypothetical protein DN600_15655 [Aeromonas caviae]|nr:hypothetical protein DN600_15655 [Aeromonas caviae]RWT03744.1 hypothetical protein DN618_05000 [Aeromonas caviae]
MMEALRVMTYFKVSLSTCNWDSAFFMGAWGLTALFLAGSFGPCIKFIHLCDFTMRWTDNGCWDKR